jgi:hypothetical protein
LDPEIAPEKSVWLDAARWNLASHDTELEFSGGFEMIDALTDDLTQILRRQVIG